MVSGDLGKLIAEVENSELAFKIHQAVFGEDNSSDIAQNLFLDNLVLKQIKSATDYRKVIEEAEKIGISEENVVSNYTKMHQGLIKSIGATHYEGKPSPKYKRMNKDRITAYLHLATFHESRFQATGDEESLQIAFRNRGTINDFSNGSLFYKVPEDEIMIPILNDYSPSKLLEGKSITQQKTIDVMLKFIEKSLWGEYKSWGGNNQWGFEIRRSPIKSEIFTQHCAQVLTYLRQYVDKEEFKFDKMKYNRYKVHLLDFIVNRTGRMLEGIGHPEDCGNIFGTYDTKIATEMTRRNILLASLLVDSYNEQGIKVPDRLTDQITRNIKRLEEHYATSIYQPLPFQTWFNKQQ